jgi:hypothetical protein
MTVLPTVRDQLLRTAERRASGQSSGRPSRLRGLSAARWLPAGHLLAAALVAVSIVIGAAAIVVIGARRSVPISPAAVGSVRASRQQLIRLLGVLRRPQTSADLDPTFVPGFFAIAQSVNPFIRPPGGLERRMAQLGNPELDRSLVRVITIPGWNAKVALTPATWQPSRASDQRSEGLDLELQVGASGLTGTGPRPTSVADVQAHGLAISNAVPVNGSAEGVIVVPDGVAKVTLTPIRLISPPAALDPLLIGTTTTTVHENVAPFKFSIPAAINRRMWSNVYGVPAVAKAIWFDANGNVIRQTTTHLDLFVNVLGKGPVPTPRPTIP